MNIPALIILVILGISLLGRIAFLTYLMFILSVFGSLALLPPELLGGSSVTPGAVAALLLVCKALSMREVRANALKVMMDVRRLGLLSLFLILAVLGACFLPAFFSGEIRAFMMKSEHAELIVPTMSNFTQAAYLTLSTLMAIVIAALMRDAAFTRMLPKAILAGAWAVIVTGLLDLAGNHAGLPEVMSSLRTASYAFLTDNDIMGTRRIIGLMPEASSYGSMAAGYCGLLLFLKPAFPPMRWQWRVSVAAWGCGAMALLSTSSAAYVMMAVVIALYAFYNVHSIAADGSIVRKTILGKIIAFGCVLAVGAVIIQLDRALADQFIDLVNALIFKKQATSSYAERSSWTAAAIDAFFASDGAGVGVGSVRTSNFFANILASTGVLGTALFAAFLWVTFTRKAAPKNPYAQVTIKAAKLALIPMFVAAMLIGTTPDFGIMQGVLFGMIAGLAGARTTLTASRAASPL